MIPRFTKAGTPSRIPLFLLGFNYYKRCAAQHNQALVARMAVESAITHNADGMKEYFFKRVKAQDAKQNVLHKRGERVPAMAYRRGKAGSLKCCILSAGTKQSTFLGYSERVIHPPHWSAMRAEAKRAVSKSFSTRPQRTSTFCISSLAGSP